MATVDLITKFSYEKGRYPTSLLIQYLEDLNLQRTRGFPRLLPFRISSSNQAISPQPKGSEPLILRLYIILWSPRPGVLHNRVQIFHHHYYHRCFVSTISNQNSSDDECHDSEVALTQKLIDFLVRGLLP